jgi:hypothetical protein
LDLIASEYGWSDDVILDTTMPRLRQIQEMILARQDDERQFLLKLEEVKLQVLAGAVHGAAGNKRGVKAASKIKLARRDREIADYDKVARLFGVTEDE